MQLGGSLNMQLGGSLNMQLGGSFNMQLGGSSKWLIMMVFYLIIKYATIHKSIYIYINILTCSIYSM